MIWSSAIPVTQPEAPARQPLSGWRAELSAQMREIIATARIPEVMRDKLKMCLTCDQPCPGITACKRSPAAES